MARAKHRLALVLKKSATTTAEAQSLYNESYQMMSEFCTRHKDIFDPPEGLDEGIIFDHLVSFEAGRTMIGQLRTDNIY